MSEVQNTNPKALSCPRCGRAMELKKSVSASGIDYFFKCDTCAIEYTNPPRGQTAPTTGPTA
jgi:predicted  nucleic acid-binding Zn ribbon protein